MRAWQGTIDVYVVAAVNLSRIASSTGPLICEIIAVDIYFCGIPAVDVVSEPTINEVATINCTIDNQRNACRFHGITATGTGAAFGTDSTVSRARCAVFGTTTGTLSANVWTSSAVSSARCAVFRATTGTVSANVWTFSAVSIARCAVFGTTTGTVSTNVRTRTTVRSARCAVFGTTTGAVSTNVRTRTAVNSARCAVFASIACAVSTNAVPCGVCEVGTEGIPNYSVRAVVVGFDSEYKSPHNEPPAHHDQPIYTSLLSSM